MVFFGTGPIETLLFINIISPVQHCCCTQYISSILDQHGQGGVIYTDFSKDFDSLYAVLLVKLQRTSKYPAFHKVPIWVRYYFKFLLTILWTPSVARI